MTDGDFQCIKQLAKEKTGIELGDHKKEMIYSRIVRRIRALKLSNFKSYLQYLDEFADQELSSFINAITTNLTSFFRESHHFEFLSKSVFPELKKKKRNSRRIRIWSAGCSTGEEPYSLAMTLNGSIDDSWDAKILATDLDTNVLQHGKMGIYGLDRIGNLDKGKVKNYFESPDGRRITDSDQLQTTQSIRQLITFNQLNLLEDWPMKGKFDVIFCRNVVIYFSKETQRKLFDRYADALEPDGYLFIGHAESLHGVSKRFVSVGRTIYRKIK